MLPETGASRIKQRERMQKGMRLSDGHSTKARPSISCKGIARGIGSSGEGRGVACSLLLRFTMVASAAGREARDGG